MESVKALMKQSRSMVAAADSSFSLREAESKTLHKQDLRDAAVVKLAAQGICDHEYYREERWTEDGAYPNEPHSRTICTLCDKVL